MATLRSAFLGGTFRDQPALGAVRAGVDESIGRSRQREALESQELANQGTVEARERAQLDAAKAGILEANETERTEGIRVARQVQAAKTPQEFAFLQQQNPIDLGESTFEDARLNSRFVLAANDEIEKQGLKSAAESFFESRKTGLTEEQRQEADLISLGLRPRAVAAAPRFISEVGAVVDPGTAIGERVTVAGEVQTPQVIATKKAQEEEAKKFASATGADRAKTIKDSFSQLQNIERNNRNIDRAVDAIDSGASTGFLQSFFPNIRASSVRLNNVVNTLGLDVVGSVTFGALSKGELDLALATAIPTTLSPPELKEWLLNKKDAQTKMIGYLDNQIQFLEGGGSVAEFRRQQQTDLGDIGSMTDDELLARLRGG